MKKLLSTLTIMACALQLSAQQDTHYSQFYAVPTYLNPAATGNFMGDFRFVTNYRTQWKSIINRPFTTITAGFDAPIRPPSTSNNFGAGIYFFTDKAGDGAFKTDNYSFSGSYVIEVDKNSYFSLGLGLGMIQRSINFQDLYWDNQWTGQTFDKSAFSGENGFGDKLLVLDLSGGVYYQGITASGMRVSAGAAAAHLNRPDMSYFAASDDYIMKFTLHGGLEVPIPNSRLRVVPSALIVVQGPNQIINAGTDFKYMIKEASRALVFVDEISASIGTYYRVGDAAYFTARFDYAAFGFGAAYDMTLSDLSTYNGGNGALEFFVSWTGTLGQSGGISSFR